MIRQETTAPMFDLVEPSEVAQHHEPGNLARFRHSTLREPLFVQLEELERALRMSVRRGKLSSLEQLDFRGERIDFVGGRHRG